MLGGLSFPTLLLHASMGPGSYLARVYAICRSVLAAVATLPLVYTVFPILKSYVVYVNTHIVFKRYTFLHLYFSNTSFLMCKNKKHPDGCDRKKNNEVTRSNPTHNFFCQLTIQ